jgi:hypothetical protein
MTARYRPSAGDWVSAVPLLTYFALGLKWRMLPQPWSETLVVILVGSVFLAIGAIGYGTMLVVLDDLVSWRRSPEQKRWLLRLGAILLGCVMFLGELGEAWKWLDD